MLSALARWLGAVPKDEREGICLHQGERWLVGPTKDVPRFLRALPLLGLEGAVMYFEDTAEAHVREYLARVSGPAQAKVAVGTIWPRPDCYHVPLTAQSAEAFAQFLEQHPAGFVSAHCHLYRNGSVVLEWHDAFWTDPMYVAITVTEEQVAAFASALGTSCERAI